MAEPDPQETPPTQPVEETMSKPDTASMDEAEPSVHSSSAQTASTSTVSETMAGQPTAQQLAASPQAAPQPGAVPSGLAIDASMVSPTQGVPVPSRPRFFAQRVGRRVAIGIAGVGAAALLVGAGFLAGIHVRGDGDGPRLMSGRGSMGSWDHGRFGRGDGPARGQMPGGGLPGDRHRDATGPMGRGAGPGAAAFVTAGPITAINGSTLTLSTFQGETAKVTTTTSTTVQGAAGGNLSSLRVGEIIFVTGGRANDGSYQATAITTRPRQGARVG